MFEKFTAEALKVIMLAQEAARHQRHNHVATEQILLGLIGERNGVAAKVLGTFGINLENARKEVDARIGKGEDVIMEEIPFTQGAKRLLLSSWEESNLLGASQVATEHLLLGLLTVEEDQGLKVLEHFGIDIPKLRDEITKNIPKAVLRHEANLEQTLCGALAHVSQDIRHAKEITEKDERSEISVLLRAQEASLLSKTRDHISKLTFDEALDHAVQELRHAKATAIWNEEFELALWLRQEEVALSQMFQQPHSVRTMSDQQMPSTAYMQKSIRRMEDCSAMRIQVVKLIFRTLRLFGLHNSQLSSNVRAGVTRAMPSHEATLEQVLCGALAHSLQDTRRAIEIAKENQKSDLVAKLSLEETKLSMKLMDPRLQQTTEEALIHAIKDLRYAKNWAKSNEKSEWYTWLQEQERALVETLIKIRPEQREEMEKFVSGYYSVSLEQASGSVFAQYTQDAIAVIMFAQEEAGRMGHNFVDTEQIFLGVLREPKTIASKTLKSFDVDLKRARVEVEKIIGQGSKHANIEFPFTPRAERVLELSRDESTQLGHHHIEPEHLLLGLIREGNGVAMRVLESLGVSASTLRKRLVEQISSPG